MQFRTITSTIGLIVSTTAAPLDEIPSCAVKPILNPAYKSNCSPTDYNCICNNDINPALILDIQHYCSADDQTIAVAVAKEVCSAVTTTQSEGYRDSVTPAISDHAATPTTTANEDALYSARSTPAEFSIPLVSATLKFGDFVRSFSTWKYPISPKSTIITTISSTEQVEMPGLGDIAIMFVAFAILSMVFARL